MATPSWKGTCRRSMPRSFSASWMLAARLLARYIANRTAFLEAATRAPRVRCTIPIRWGTRRAARRPAGVWSWPWVRQTWRSVGIREGLFVSPRAGAARMDCTRQRAVGDDQADHHTWRLYQEISRQPLLWQSDQCDSPAGRGL